MTDLLCCICSVLSIASVPCGASEDAHRPPRSSIGVNAIWAAIRDRAQVTPERMTEAWTTLHLPDDRGQPRGQAFFLSVPDQTIAFFARQIQPAVKPRPGEVEALIEELGSPDFVRRSKAYTAIDRLHRLARPAVQSALYRNPTLETARRLEQLVKKMDDITMCPEILRQRAAIWILYTMNTPASRDLLRHWSSGAPEAYLTREAKDRLDSLERASK